VKKMQLNRQGGQERQGNQKYSLTAEAQSRRRRPESKLRFEIDLIDLLCDLRASAVGFIFLGVLGGLGGSIAFLTP
jgi:hypothetical protein